MPGGTGRVDTEPIVAVAPDPTWPARLAENDEWVGVREVDVVPCRLMKRELSEVIIVFE